jgi:hypothetical protein
MASSKITKDTFNGIQAKLASILGAPDQSTVDLGYNLTFNSSQVQTNAIVYGDDVNKAIGDLNTIIQHQTGFPTNLSLFSPGQLITATDLNQLSSITTSAVASRNNVGASLLAVKTSDSYSDGSTWNTIRQHSVTLDWGTNNNFRGWTNAGGFISVSASFSGGSGTPQTGAWATLLTSAGTLVFSGNATFQSNNNRAGSIPNGGLYNIIQNGQIAGHDGIAFRMLSTENHYTSNAYTLVVNPYPTGTGMFNCTGFTLTASMTDPHTAPARTTDDYIDSLFSWSVNTYYAYQQQVPTVVATSNNIS